MFEMTKWKKKFKLDMIDKMEKWIFLLLDLINNIKEIME